MIYRAFAKAGILLLRSSRFRNGSGGPAFAGATKRVPGYSRLRTVLPRTPKVACGIWCGLRFQRAGASLPL